MFEKNAGYYLALFGKVVISLVVAAFLSLHTINFFGYIFPVEQQMYSWLGFGLTGGAIFVYILILKYGASTNLVKVVALVMLVVSVIGELLAAGFGMQVEAWKKAGFAMTQEDFSSMILVIQVLGLAHAAALILMTVGDEVFALFEKAPAKAAAAPAVSNNPLTIPRSPAPINHEDANPTN
ncbi:MAG: hypothetical protein J0L96_14765 [Anaerolineae bacterium]|nr:hypothetical protein [Anaerolineae bacterium]